MRRSEEETLILRLISGDNNDGFTVRTFLQDFLRACRIQDPVTLHIVIPDFLYPLIYLLNTCPADRIRVPVVI